MWAFFLVVGGVLAALVGGGVAVGYRYFWNQYQGPGRWEIEAQRWEFVVKKTPQDPEAWYQLGYAYFQKGELDRAEEAFRKALEVDPQAVEMNYFIGLVKLRKKQYAEAEKLFQKVADIAPGNPLPQYQLAVALFEQKKYDQAIERLKWINERIDPSLSDVHYLLGAAYEGKGDKEKAREAYFQAVRYDPAFEKARQALLRLGVPEKDIPEMPAETTRAGEIEKIPVPQDLRVGETLRKEGQ